MNVNQSSRLRAHVEFFSEMDPPRSCWNFDALKKSVNYIVEKMAKYGYNCENQDWEVRGNTYSNIIAHFGDLSKPKLVVGAHYDVYGNMPGADDNASGVSGLLEIAKILSSKKPNLEYCIEIVFYCLEEPPFFGTHEMGSFIHAKSLNDNEVDVFGMVCLDMIGYFDDAEGSQTYPSDLLQSNYPSKANYIVAIGINEYKTFLNRFYELMLPKAKVAIEKIEFPDGEGLAGLSDHSNYWHFGYPALMINNTAFLRNDNYHQPTDLPNTLDYSKMSAVVNAVALAIQTL